MLVGAGLYVRLTIEETPVFRAAQRQQPATHTPLREAFTRTPREILLAGGSLTGLFALFYTGTTYLTSYGISPTGAALSGLTLLSLICTAALTETKDRDLQQDALESKSQEVTGVT